MRIEVSIDRRSADPAAVAAGRSGGPATAGGHPGAWPRWSSGDGLPRGSVAAGTR